MTKLMRAAVAMVVALGCAAKPDAAAVCKQIEVAGIAKGCVQVKPEVINARARTKLDFDLVNVQGKKGAVLDFLSDDDYTATVSAYTAAAMLAGPHRYGNPSTRIFVQLNTQASLEEGNAVKAIVAGEPVPAVRSGSAPSVAVSTASGATAAEAPDLPKPVALLAVDLYDQYQKNEVAADEKYKGKRLRVAGQLLSIDKDALGNMVLKMMAGESQFASVTARVQDSEKSKVVGLDKKQALVVECEGAGMVLKTPSLQNCTIFIVGKKL